MWAHTHTHTLHLVAFWPHLGQLRNGQRLTRIWLFGFELKLTDEGNTVPQRPARVELYRSCQKKEFIVYFVCVCVCRHRVKKNETFPTFWAWFCSWFLKRKNDRRISKTCRFSRDEQPGRFKLLAIKKRSYNYNGSSARELLALVADHRAFVLSANLFFWHAAQKAKTAGSMENVENISKSLQYVIFHPEHGTTRAH